VLYAWRWQLLLAVGGVRLPFEQVLEQYVVGVFVNNFLPSMIGGDSAKVFYLGRAHGYRQITTSVMLDRLLGVGLLSVLATAALWRAPRLDARFLTARVVLTMVTAAFVLGVLVVATGPRGMSRVVGRFGARAATLAGHLQLFRLDLVRAVRSPAVWVLASVTVVVYFVLLTLVYEGFVTLQSGLRVPFATMFTLATSVAVLSHIPIAINGIGLREQLHVALLAPLRVSPEVAVALSLLLFAHLLLVSLVCGVSRWRVTRGLTDAGPR